MLPATNQLASQHTLPVCISNAANQRSTPHATVKTVTVAIATSLTTP
ncbi:MAG: hypothetical protein AAGF24_08090 [Cyanobacteria bacterium P01_H01_bin.121]